MAKKQSQTATQADLDPQHAVELLRRQLEAGQSLEALAIVPVDDFRGWKNTTIEFIRRAFGSASSNVTTFSRAGDPSVWSGNADQSYYNRMRMTSLKGKIAILKSCIDQLEAMAPR